MSCQRSIVPSVDAGVALVVGRNRRALHVPEHAHDVAVGFGRRRRLDDIHAADRAAVDVRLVREIHQVVDEQRVARFDRREVFDVMPRRIDGPRNLRQRRRIGALGIAHPDPHERSAFDERKRAHAGVLRHRRLAGHRDARAAGIVHEAVIAAHDRCRPRACPPRADTRDARSDRAARSAVPSCLR